MWAERWCACVCRREVNPQDWSVEEVGEWLADELGLAECIEPFRKARVDGAALLRLCEKEEARLAGILGPLHPLTKRKLQLGVARLRDREFCDTGLSMERLDEYIAQLDRTRVSFVARLKALFDAQDTDKEGKIGHAQVTAALTELWAGEEVSEAQRKDAQEWVAALQVKEAELDFPDFVQGVSDVVHRDKAHIKAKAMGGSPARKAKGSALVDMLQAEKGHKKGKDEDEEEDEEGGKGRKGRKGGRSALEAVADELKAKSEHSSSSDDEPPRRSPTRGQRQEAFEWDSVHQVRGA